MRVLILILAAWPAVAQTDSRAVNWLWRGSVVTLYAGESLDAASSWQQPEGNRLWGSPRFGVRGLAQTVAINGAVTAGEYYALRAAKRTRWRWLAAGAFIAANVYSGARAARQARRNWR